MKHLKIKIRGRVQGVWFRGAAQRKAEELGLCGFVQNLPDGSVYAEAEGPEDRLQAFVRWCWEGPELAKVAHVETQEDAVQGFGRFDILR